MLSTFLEYKNGNSCDFFCLSMRKTSVKALTTRLQTNFSVLKVQNTVINILEFLFQNILRQFLVVSEDKLWAAWQLYNDIITPWKIQTSSLPRKKPQKWPKSLHFFDIKCD